MRLTFAFEPTPKVLKTVSRLRVLVLKLWIVSERVAWSFCEEMLQLCGSIYEFLRYRMTCFPHLRIYRDHLRVCSNRSLPNRNMRSIVPVFHPC